MRRPLTTLLVGAAWCLAGVVSATTVYKSVDANGNVTYSMTPPATAEKTRRMEVDGGGDQREAARRELEDARRAFADAKAVRDADWSRDGGSQRLSDDYHERVRAAKARVAGAERAAAQHCAPGECGDVSWQIDVHDAQFRASGSVGHGESQHVELDAEGRRIAQASARREEHDSEARREVLDADARREEQGADAREVVWDGSARTTVRDAEERHEVL